jgi:hypothetical protein
MQTKKSYRRGDAGLAEGAGSAKADSYFGISEGIYGMLNALAGLIG